MKEICFECGGRQVNDNEFITLLRVCQKCGGTGEVDWIDNLIPTSKYQKIRPKPDINPNTILFDIAQRNIQRLIRQIHMEASLINMVCDINYEFKSCYIDPAPNMIIPGGF